MSTGLVYGPVAVGIRQSSHFKGVRLLLGNDSADDKVVIHPFVTDTSCMDQNPNPIEREPPDPYSSCAIITTMAKKAMLTDDTLLRSLLMMSGL